MAGVFEVEVDGVEHDHGLEHHDQPNQVIENRPRRRVVTDQSPRRGFI